MSVTIKTPRTRVPGKAHICRVWMPSFQRVFWAAFATGGEKTVDAIAAARFCEKLNNVRQRKICESPLAGVPKEKASGV